MGIPTHSSQSDIFKVSGVGTVHDRFAPRHELMIRWSLSLYFPVLRSRWSSSSRGNVKQQTCFLVIPFSFPDSRYERSRGWPFRGLWTPRALQDATFASLPSPLKLRCTVSLGKAGEAFHRLDMFLEHSCKTPRTLFAFDFTHPWPVSTDLLGPLQNFLRVCREKT